ncbi:TonB-dependent receptor plug domain protein, partial [Ostertagia ostertagi]
YESQEVAVGTQTTITVRLVSGKKSMDEVVVVGYGEQSRRKVTGAVATLNTENFDERPIARLDQGLVGQIAGVQVRQTTGSVGKPFSITVRGGGSISAGNEPLYVIDGFPMEPQRTNSSGNFDNGSPLDNINPNDIESIQVLKDAAAAAIYGSRASNGNGVLTNEDIEKGYPMFGTQKVGDPRYVDANGDGKITDADRVIAGQPNPKYFWGITNTFRYKNFDLSVFIQGQNGGYIYSLLGRAINSTNMGNTSNTLDVDIATRGNNQTNYTAPFNTDWLYKSDYISIRSITLGYDLGKLFKSNYIQGARIYMSLENWFYWDKYKGGFNPEATNANLSSDANFSVPGDYGGLPVARSSVLGINFTF